MYPRIVPQIAFIGTGALGASVVNSALKSSDPSFAWQRQSSEPWAPSAEPTQPASLPPALSPYSSYLLSFHNALSPHVRPQGFRNHDAPIRLLVILQNRHPCPAHCQSAPIQSMHQFCLVLALRPVADVRPPRLVRLKIRARRNLPK